MGIGSWSFAQGGSEESMLPESGTIGLGYNVGSLLRTAGNLFYGSSTNNNHFVNNDNAIFAKYYLSESMAIRAQVRIGVGSGNFSHWVAQDGGTNPWFKLKINFHKTLKTIPSDWDLSFVVEVNVFKVTMVVLRFLALAKTKESTHMATL